MKHPKPTQRIHASHAERRLGLRPALVSDSGPGLSSGEVGWAGADQAKWVRITFSFHWPQLEARPVTVLHGDGMSSSREHKQPWTALHRWPALAVKLGISLPPTLPDTGVASQGGPGTRTAEVVPLHLPLQLPGTPVRERDIHVEKLRDRAASMREGRRKPGSQEAQVSLLEVPRRSPGTEVLSGCCLSGMGASVFIGQLSSDSSQEERRRQVDFLETSFSYEIGVHDTG